MRGGDGGFTRLDVKRGDAAPPAEQLMEHCGRLMAEGGRGDVSGAAGTETETKSAFTSALM